MRENKRAARATRTHENHRWTDKQQGRSLCFLYFVYHCFFRQNVAENCLKKRQNTISWTVLSYLVGRRKKLHYLISESCGCWAVKETYNNQQAFTFMSSRRPFCSHCLRAYGEKRYVYLIPESYCPVFALTVLLATNWKQNRSALGLERLSFLRVTRASRLSAAVSLSVCA